MAQWVIDILQERGRQDVKFGTQEHPSGTGYQFEKALEFWREQNSREVELNELTWASILMEEVYEALCETQVPKLKTELIQVMAVCLAWMEDLER